jgi:NAD(P)-dependent dehydrogenase (short-subunit alcohol dehydrogenase family)
MTALNCSSLDGRVALVIGVGPQNSIGFACAEAMAAAGAVVAAADLAGAGAGEAVTKLPSQGHSAHDVDVTDEASVDALVAATVAAHGGIDIVVNSAGIMEINDFLDIPVESWDRVFNVNIRGQFLVCQRVARQMVAQGRGGRIIPVASNVGRLPRLKMSPYAASKAGVIHMVHCMALELAQHGITVNALCPGPTATSMLVGTTAKGNPELLDGIIKGSIEQWRTGIPLGRLADPNEQASVAVFLASEGGRFINGQAICVDGGQHLS